MMQKMNKHISSHRRNNRTIDYRENKSSPFGGGGRRKKKKVKSIKDNFLSLDSNKNIQKKESEMKEIPPMKPIQENIYFSDLQRMNEKIPQEEANQPLTITISSSSKINIHCDICFEEGENLTFHELQNCKHAFHSECLHSLI